MGLLDRILGRPRQPDLHMAANGFFPIALLRATGQQVDTAAMLQTYVEALEAQGHAADQLLAARWGGTCAMRQGPEALAQFLAAADPGDGAPASLKMRQWAAGAEILAGILETDPDAFETFLVRMRQHVSGLSAPDGQG